VSADSALGILRAPHELRQISVLDWGQPHEHWVGTNGSKTVAMDAKPQVVASEPGVLLSFHQEFLRGCNPVPLGGTRRAAVGCLQARAFRVVNHAGRRPASIFVKVPANKNSLPEVKAFITHIKRQVGEADVLKLTQVLGGPRSKAGNGKRGAVRLLPNLRTKELLKGSDTRCYVLLLAGGYQSVAQAIELSQKVGHLSAVQPRH
jgi:hypothetical protein